jgi:hypothetical protein
MDKNEIKKEVYTVIDDVWRKLKYGQIERGWEVYDEFKSGLARLVNKL